MDMQHPTQIELACHVSHRAMLEAIRLRDRLADELERPELVESSRFDRVWHALGLAQRRLLRRRLRWLALQRDVFVELGRQARTYAIEADVRCSAARLADELTLAALRSIAGRR
jgi:hypothetical protein